MTRKRYSIMVVQCGAGNEVELCQVDNDPLTLAAAAREKMLRISAGGRVVYIPKYTAVRVVDHKAVA
jgi:hypothetical protein